MEPAAAETERREVPCGLRVFAEPAEFGFGEREGADFGEEEAEVRGDSGGFAEEGGGEARHGGGKGGGVVVI